MSGLKTMAQCTECKTTFQVDASNVAKKEFEAQDGNRVWLTYYDCPECGRRHYVQIDTAKTNGVLINLTKQMGKITALKKRGMRVSKKQRTDFEKTKRHLTELRNELMKRYQEQEMVAVDGHSEKVVFVV